MAYLILDLDLTVFATERDLKNLDSSVVRTLAKGMAAAGFKDKILDNYSVFIINPKSLSSLINYAFDYHDGVMFLTSGLWLGDSIKNLLLQNLLLGPKARANLAACRFINPEDYVSDADYDLDNLLDIGHILKNIRFNQYLDKNPDLKNKHFVLLDDHPDHIDSFKEHKLVTGILATTDLEDKTFYQQAADALDVAKINENVVETSNKRKEFFSAADTFFPRSPGKKQKIEPLKIRETIDQISLVCEETLSYF